MKKTKFRKNLTRAMALILMLVLSISAVTVSGSAATTEVLPNGSYVIYTMTLTTCLNVQYAKKNGGKVCVDHASLEDNEIWVLKNVDRGYVTLSPKNAPNCYLSGENGFDKQLVIRQCVPSEAIYQWLPIPAGNGYVFKNRATGYVIDSCDGLNTTIGNPFIQYTRGYDVAQVLFPVRISSVNNLTPGVRVTNLVSGNYKVALFNNKNQVWNAQYGLKVGAGLVCDPYNGEPNEIIYIKAESNGLYSLRFAADHSLCIAPPDVFVDTQLKVSKYDGSLRCLYEIYKVGNTYCFRNAFTGLMIDDWYCRTATGTRMASVYYNECNAQQFYLTKVSASSSGSTSSSSTQAPKSDYATYTGVNYRNQTSDSRRIAACDKAVKMATVLWKSDCDFPTWKSSKGGYNTVTATDGTSSTKFLKGKTYQGIPYSMAGRTYTDTRWLVLTKNGLRTDMMTGKYYTSKRDTTAYGIDCSYLVCTALNAGCGTSINLNTNGMLNSSRFTKISRSQMLPGDIFLKSGHVMFFMGKTSSGQYAIIEANASFSRVVYRELPASSLSSYGCYRFNGFR